MPLAADNLGSADPQFWDPWFLLKAVVKPQTPPSGVRATRPCQQEWNSWRSIG